MFFFPLKSLSCDGSCAALLPGAPGELLYEYLVFLPWSCFLRFAYATCTSTSDAYSATGYLAGETNVPNKIALLFVHLCSQ